jgi:adenylate cyclase
MPSPNTKRNIARIIPFGLIWLLVGWFVLFIQEAATGNVNVNPEVVITLTPGVFLFASLTVFLVGLLVGMLEVLWLGKLFGSMSFAKKIGFKMGFYTLFILLVILFTYPPAAGIELGVSPFDPAVWEKFTNYALSLDFFSTIAAISFSLFLCLFYSGISDNLGHGVLMNFFTGKYHSPTEEKRIFMFLDMKSSTTIAEQLGHIRYFELLKEYYDDFSQAIIDCSGEVYQYVGDEVVISWNYEAGIAGNSCLRCFFAMKAALQKKTAYYKAQYGVSPSFKAGLHFGDVTAGEIGALKKEIIFTGDVLNTTARIQGRCNHLGVDLLVSEALIDLLALEPDYQLRSLGESSLRGKQEQLRLVTVIKKGG